MTKDLQSILQAPEWSMDDAYGSVGSEKWNQSIERAAALVNALHSMERPVAVRRWLIISKSSMKPIH